MVNHMVSTEWGFFLRQFGLPIYVLGIGLQLYGSEEIYDLNHICKTTDLLMVLASESIQLMSQMESEGTRMGLLTERVFEEGLRVFFLIWRGVWNDLVEYSICLMNFKKTGKR